MSEDDRVEIERLTAILDDALKWWNAQQAANIKRTPPWVIDARVALGKRQ